MRDRTRKITILAGIAAIMGVGSVNFASALELTAVDYGAKIGSALSLKDLQTAQDLIANLKACGVSALSSEAGTLTLVDIELAMSGAGAADAALLLAANSFIVDQKSVPSVNCAAKPLAFDMMGSGVTDSSFPVGSTG